MKKLFIITVLILSGMCLVAQTLYVKPKGVAQIAYPLANKPKITFGEGFMQINMQSMVHTYQFQQLQNLSFTPTIGIEEYEENGNISVYPNPVKEEVTIKFETFTQGLSYRIFDMNGKQIKADNIHSELTRINMQQFMVGTFIIGIENNGKQIQSFKIVKQ